MNNKDDAFHNQGRSFRTRKGQKMETMSTYTHDKFGNDTTKLLGVKVS